MGTVIGVSRCDSKRFGTKSINFDVLVNASREMCRVMAHDEIGMQLRSVFEEKMVIELKNVKKVNRASVSIATSLR